MKQANVRFNYHDYLQLPEDKRYEILDGDLCVVPAPNIRTPAGRPEAEAGPLPIRRRPSASARCFDAPCDVVLSEENVVQPDILFVRKERLGIIGEANIRGAPDLVDRNPLPGNAATGSRYQAKDLCQVRRAGVLDRRSRCLHRRSARLERVGLCSAGVFTGTDRLSSPLLPELNLPLFEIFKKE